MMLIIAYALLGPPLGALAFWSVTLLPTALLAMLQSNWGQLSWSPAVKLLMIYASYSYLLGFLPALGTGIGHALAQRKIGRRRLRVIFATATGLFLPSLLMLVGVKTARLDETTIAFVAAGGIAAFLIASAAELVAARRPPRLAAS